MLRHGRSLRPPLPVRLPNRPCQKTNGDLLSPWSLASNLDSLVEGAILLRVKSSQSDVGSSHKVSDVRRHVESISKCSAIVNRADSVSTLHGLVAMMIWPPTLTPPPFEGGERVRPV